MDTGDMTRYVSIFPLFSKMDHSHIFLSFKESSMDLCIIVAKNKIALMDMCHVGI